MFLNQEIEKIIRENYNGRYLDRDIRLILEYFGFGDEVYPTEEFLSKKYNVGNTRGGGSYVITTKFNKNTIRHTNLIAKLQEINFFLNSQKHHFYSDFLFLLKEKNLIDQTVHLPGLFTLLKYFDLAHNYDIYDVKINKVERGNFEIDREYIIIDKSIRSNIRNDLKRVFEKLGKASIRCLDDVYNKKKDFYLSEHEVKRVIRATEGSWCLDAYDKFWFLIETRENRIVNLLRKIYKIGKSFERTSLADVLSKSLREYTKTKPTSEIIKKYLDSCKYVSVSGGYYILSDVLDASEVRIEEPETVIIDYLKKNGPSVRSNILKYLETLGFLNKSTIDSYLEFSPLFLKRKMDGGPFKNIFIGEYSNNNQIFHEDRYSDLLKILRNLDDTDGKAEQKIRKEQSYLRLWLFEGKAFEKCALCGKEYSVQSLVAAHKKPREHCSPNERTDPYIVMPACKFGCDQMYEKRWVKIRKGVIEADNLKMSNLSNTEKEHIEKIQGRKIDGIWLIGEESYFSDF